MRLVVIGLGLGMLAGSLAAQDRILSMEPGQIERLGLKLVRPEPAREIPLGYVPAMVTVPPQAESLVSAPVAGMIEEVKAARGDAVAAGQVLARINSQELLGAQQRLLDAWQDLRVAKASYAREKSLFQEGVIAKRRWLNTQKIRQQADTAFIQAREELVLLGMTRAAIDRLLATGQLDGRLDLVSPAAGIVTSREVIAGQRVERLTPLFRIMSILELWLEMAVPVARAGHLSPGALVRTEPQGATGEVILIGGTVDPATQTVLVRAKLTEAKGLRPGCKVTVALFELASKPLLKIPRSALVDHQGGQFVFVRTPQGFQATSVEVAAQTYDAAFLVSGIEPASQVVSQGVAALKAAWLGVGEE